MQRITRILFLALLALLPTRVSAQATTQFVGTFRDSGANLVTTGEVEFDLQPSVDTTINGYARFTPVANICFIHGTNQSPFYTLTRSGSTVTLLGVGHNLAIAAADTIWITGASDSSFNGAFTVATNDGNGTLTWAQALGNSTATGATFTTLEPSIAPGPCQLVQNSAVVPAGTSYKVTVMPSFTPTSVFVMFAVGSGPIDLSTVVPTPATMPVYSIPTLAGNNTWTGAQQFNANVNLFGGGNLSGTFIGSPTFSLGGTLSHFGTQNFFGTFNSTGGGSFSGTYSGSATWTGVHTFGSLFATTVTSRSANPSATGVVRLAFGDLIGWRNANNSGDIPMGTDAQNGLTYNSFVLPQVIFNTPLIGQTGSFGPVSLDINVAPGTFRVTFYVSQSALGASCGGSTTLQLSVNYRDPNEPAAASSNVGSAFSITTNGAVGRVGFVSTVFVQKLVITNPVFTYSGVYSAGGSCSPPPALSVYPIVERIG